VRNLPAYMGYSICDHCCTNNVDTSLQSQVYQIIKTLVPY
jgi:hypothetical protein